MTAPTVPPANTVNVDQLPRGVALWMYQGADFGMSLTLTSNGVALDLAGATVDAELRDTTGSPDVLATFVTAVIAPNIITLNLSAEVTATLPARARWDCFVRLATGSRLAVTYGPVVVARRTTVVSP